ncbi:hypothetical protein PIB30_036604 [Stylosanthes scabra]|uniref:Uncharacterized protein n=1 Tax=Stylosanthes scabra TaxID=79078 RepID=A0ABU6RDH7_9FABA|nr:hypothetical protein [Stylosanthes scabra]
MVSNSSDNGSGRRRIHEGTRYANGAVAGLNSGGSPTCTKALEDNGLTEEVFRESHMGPKSGLQKETLEESNKHLWAIELVGNEMENEVGIRGQVNLQLEERYVLEEGSILEPLDSEGNNKKGVAKRKLEEEGVEERKKSREAHEVQNWVLEDSEEIEDESEWEAGKAWDSCKKVGLIARDEAKATKYLQDDGEETIAQLAINVGARGIKGEGKMAVVNEMVRKNEIRFLALVETKTSRLKEYENFLQVTRVTKGARWIGLEGLVEGISETLIIYEVYAPNLVVERRAVWKELLAYKQQIGLPALAFGDFNEVLRKEERSSSKGSLVGIRDFNE